MKYLTYEKFEHIGIVKFSRKEVLNALSRPLLEEFLMFLELLAKGQQIRVLVLSGDGDKSFSSGGDIAEMQTMGHLEVLRFFELGQQVASALENAPFLTIAAVNGYAFGGGFEMALACDYIYASEKAVFGLPEVRLGLVPAFGGTQRLTEAIGLRAAKEMILTGREISVKEAFDLKIVNQVCKPEDLLKEACESGAAILSHPFSAVQQAKRAINLASFLGAGNFEAERNMAAICFATGERQEQMKQFMKEHHATR
ncbi:MAG TPA: enoyl-CoA hydratase/isomerase family protein [Parachlamydiaceae bacterium]|nr:enoyl-CoA hydratase/isomerase family protein [Parachlamydiaceae bacterium]